MLKQLSKINPIFILTVFLASGNFVASSYAVSTEDFDEMNYAYGKVVSVTPSEIVLSQYDYEKDEETKETYILTSKVEIQNITALDRLAAGDEIEIYFDEDKGGKVAVIISRPHVEDSTIPTEEDDTDEKLKNMEDK